MGEYMLCALYKSYLILAIPIKQNNTRKYRVVASIALANIKIHSADCEFGLCCLMAPHVWKILFEIDSAIFEILVVATSVAEKERWTQAIRENTDRDEVNQDQFSMISLNTSSLGSVIGKPGSLLRSMAMKDVRAAKRQIIIRSNVSDCTGHVSLTMRERFAHPVLTPRRSDWARIERDLETAGFIKDVQRDASSQKSRLLRSSASTLLRKLSRSSKKRIDEVSAC